MKKKVVLKSEVSTHRGPGYPWSANPRHGTRGDKEGRPGLTMPKRIPCDVCRKTHNTLLRKRLCDRRANIEADEDRKRAAAAGPQRPIDLDGLAKTISTT